MTKIAFVYYSMYGHMKQLIDSAAKGIKETYPDVEVKIFAAPETLPQEVLTEMHVPPRDAYIPNIIPDELKWKLMGSSGEFPHDTGVRSLRFLGALWGARALKNKFTTVISSSATQNGGQETTAFTTVPYFTHQGMIFVPFGYSHPGMFTLDEAKGGSPWGAGTLAASDGSRQPSALELDIARAHGIDFAKVVRQFIAGAEEK